MTHYNLPLPKKREEILLFILGTRTKTKSVILPAREEVREREEDCNGGRGEASLLFENKGRGRRSARAA